MLTLGTPIKCARRPMGLKASEYRSRSRLTSVARAQTDVDGGKFSFVMYSILKDPTVFVLPGENDRKLVDGSAFTTKPDLENDSRRPHNLNVYVVNDDNITPDYGVGRVVHMHHNKILDVSKGYCSDVLPVYYVAAVRSTEGTFSTCPYDVEDYKFYLAQCKRDQSRVERVIFGPKLLEEIRYITEQFDNDVPP